MCGDTSVLQPHAARHVDSSSTWIQLSLALSCSESAQAYYVRGGLPFQKRVSPTSVGWHCHHNFPVLSGLVNN